MAASSNTVDLTDNSSGGSSTVEPEAGTPNENQSQAKTRSMAHQHFEAVAPGKYRCKLCKTKCIVSDKGSATSNRTRHLKNTHPCVLKPELPKESVLLQNFLKSEGFSQHEFEEHLIRFIIETNQPHSIVDSQALQKLILYCNPKAKLISNDTVKRRILSMHEKEKESLKNELQIVDSKISFALDCWTSPNQIPFQGIIAQWITEEFEFQQKVLDLDILKGRHTGLNLAESFQKVILDMNLAHKILAITTDNASNCDSFFDNFAVLMEQQGVEFSTENQRVRCLAHIINLACQDAISILKRECLMEQEAQENADFDSSGDEDDGDSDNENTTGAPVSVMQKLRTGIMRIRKSTNRRETFEKHCTLKNIKMKELERDVSTRWNSTYTLLKRALEMRLPFENTLRDEQKLKKYLLADEDWIKISDIVEFLKPFKKMTTYMSHDNTPTMSLSALVYIELYNHVEKYSERNGFSAVLVEAAKAACSKLNKYYPTSDGLVYVIGTILDPRCKLAWFSTHPKTFTADVIKRYKAILKSTWETHYKPTDDKEDLESTTTKDGNPDDLFTTQMKKAKLDKRDELQVYLADKAVMASSSTMAGGPLKWWKANKDKFPNLSTMARDYLAVLGTGVPVERLFSSGTDLVVPKRRRLKADMIRKCMCLKAWLKAQDQEYLQRFIRESVADKMLGNLNT